MKWLWIKVRRKIIKNNDFAALLRTLTKLIFQFPCILPQVLL